MTSKKTKVSMIDALAHFNDLPDCAYVRQPIVEALHSCSKSTIWRMVQAGTLPRPERLRAVEAEHQREQNELAFDVLAAQVQQLETALLSCIGDLYNIGKHLKGPSLCMSWKPSQRLARAISPGILS